MSLTAVAIKIWEQGRRNWEGQGGQGSVRSKPGFGIENQNQGPISVSVLKLIFFSETKNSQLHALQILTNNDEVENWSLSSFLLPVLIKMDLKRNEVDPFLISGQI